MGLDIYLYKYDNKELSEKLESDYEKFSSATWGKRKYEDIPEIEKDAIRSTISAYAIANGLGDYGEDEKYKHQIEIDSTIDKDHYFKIGYFRSSYNEGGINRVLENLGVPGLYEIFCPNDEYVFSPDWATALKKCEQSIKKLQKKGAYRAFHSSANIFGQNLIQSEKEAIDTVIGELAKNDNPFGEGGYSNNKGAFYLHKPIEVIAIIPGETTILSRQPCTYFVVKSENDWVLTALKIVKETIEYVLSQKDPETYYLHWSG